MMKVIVKILGAFGLIFSGMVLEEILRLNMEDEDNK